MYLGRKSKFSFWIGILFLFVLQGKSQAADGPQNSGRLFLSRTGSSPVSAVLQIDRKLALKADDFFELIQISNGTDLCSHKTAKFIANEETLTGTTLYECPRSVYQLTVSLVSPEGLPASFTLGVQSPFNHAVLDNKISQMKFDLAEKLWFFRAGLSLGMKGNEIISRPYAFSFGGLHRLPWGIWWWLVVAALLTSGMSKLGRLVCLFLGIPLSLGLAFFILSQEASLRFFSAPQVDTALLLLTVLVANLGILNNRKMRNFLGCALLTVLFIVSGFEWAIVLRWLEGNSRVLLSESMLGFYLGLGASTLSVGAIMIWGEWKSSWLNSMPSLLRMAVVSLAIYTGVSMWFQLN